MFDGRRIVAVVPARGGSKGLPGKNLRSLDGKPLIAWSIEAGLSSRYVDTLMVSTDCPQIAAAARSHGAQVPFLRPGELATDQARSIDALVHALQWLGRHEQPHQVVVLLQPTSPLRSAEDIDRAIEKFFARNAQAVVSVCETDHHPWWSNTLPEDGNMREFIRPEALNANRQALPRTYRLNGAVYVADIPFLLQEMSFYGPRTFASIMPRERSIDIDSLVDFLHAEAMVEHLRAHDNAIPQS